MHSAKITLIVENVPLEDGHAELRVRDEATPNDPPMLSVKLEKMMVDSEFVEFCRSLAALMRGKVANLHERFKNPALAEFADKLFNRG